MQDRVTVQLYKLFTSKGFGVLRFNFRGIGRSQGVFDNGMGELSDAARTLDQASSGAFSRATAGGRPSRLTFSWLTLALERPKRAAYSAPHKIMRAAASQRDMS